MVKINLTLAVLILGTAGMYANQEEQKYYDWTQWAWNKVVDSSYADDIGQYEGKKKGSYWIEKRSVKEIVPTDKCRVIRIPLEIWKERWQKYDAATGLGLKCGFGAAACLIGTYFADFGQQYILVATGVCTGGLGIANWLYRKHDVQGRIEIRPHEDLAPKLSPKDEQQYVHIALEGLMKNMQHTIETPHTPSSIIAQLMCNCPAGPSGMIAHTSTCQKIVEQRLTTRAVINAQASIAQQQANLLSSEPIIRTDQAGGSPLLHAGQYTVLDRPPRT